MISPKKLKPAGTVSSLFQLRAASVLLKTPSVVVAYSVAGIRGSIGRDRRSKARQPAVRAGPVFSPIGALEDAVLGGGVDGG